MHQPARQKVLIAASIAVALAAGVATAYLDERTMSEVSTSTEWVSQSMRAQAGFQALVSSITDAETAQRGYLLTRDSSYLDPYEHARQGWPAQVAALHGLVAQDPGQEKNVVQLERLAAEKLRELQLTIDLAKAGRRREALEIVAGGRGRLLMAHIRNTGRTAIAGQRRTLLLRNRTLQSALARRAMLSRTLTVGIAMAMALAFYPLLKLRQIEPFITMCAWTRTVQYGDEWLTFEDYLQKRFNVKVTHGIAPAEIERLVTQLDSTPPVNTDVSATLPFSAHTITARATHS